MLRSLVGSEMCIRDRFLDWEHKLETSPGRFHLVVASDVVYDGVDIGLLWKVIDTHLSRELGSQFVLGHQKRCDPEETDVLFVSFCELSDVLGFELVCEHTWQDFFVYAWIRKRTDPPNLEPASEE
eukprot:TRINITY_DN21415_c0_g1_i3.p1 TRINITY_DN21415_c0_g1~~TRINITY_DN21415_c0_g1_i3.p1  ORF type:complete len:126 (-),score=34.68 TRINITY_DN21415_c0_g1_i3:162-539(-)